MTITAKQFARKGVFYLEEAVLDVLLEAKNAKKCLGTADISRRAGIFHGSGAKNQSKSTNDAIATGILQKLKAQGRVKSCKQKGRGKKRREGWELSNEEFQARL